jgi:hypothetical protein
LPNLLSDAAWRPQKAKIIPFVINKNMTTAEFPGNICGDSKHPVIVANSRKVFKHFYFKMTLDENPMAFHSRTKRCREDWIKGDKDS